MWIFSTIGDCSKENLKEAGNEVAATMFAALIPVWLGAILAIPLSRDNGPWGVVSDFLSGNEALLVSAALVGPIMYVITKGHGQLPRPMTFKFPHALFIALSVAFIWALATGIFGSGAVADQAANGSKALRLDTASMKWISSLTLIGSIFLLFIVSALRNNIPTAADAMHKQDEEFIARWQK